MGKVVLHDEFRAGASTGPQGDVHISYRTSEDEILVFPMGKDEAIQHADQIKRKAMGLEITNEMPRGQ